MSPSFGADEIEPLVADEIGPLERAESPMSAIYPLHLQREIDRRWIQRSEQATSVRARLKAIVDVLREPAVPHHDDEKSRH